MADYLQRQHKKRPPPDAVEEPSPKQPSLETAKIDDAAIDARSQKPTPVPPAPKRKRLTKRNLRLHDAMTGATKPGAASVSSSSTPKTTKATKTSGFWEQAIANGILTSGRSKPTDNAEEMLERLNRPRTTIPPTQSQYRRYRRQIETAGNEAAVMLRMLPLFKEYGDDYNIDMNRSFSALPKGVGFNNGLSAPQPDFVQGLSREGFLPADLSAIEGAVLFKDDPSSTALPHLAGEWKSTSGNMVEAALQSSYDGAAMVYARNWAREYLGAPDPPGHSAVTTFTSNGEHITFFAHYATPTGKDGAEEDHRHYLGRTDLTDSYESFIKGRRQLRNAQDEAREHSFALRDQLREQHMSRQNQGALRTQASAATNPKANGDEDEKDGSEDERDRVYLGY